jgi:hypothetical protein
MRDEGRGTPKLLLNLPIAASFPSPENTRMVTTKPTPPVPSVESVIEGAKQDPSFRTKVSMLKSTVTSGMAIGDKGRMR